MGSSSWVHRHRISALVQAQAPMSNSLGCHSCYNVWDTVWNKILPAAAKTLTYKMCSFSLLFINSFTFETLLVHVLKIPWLLKPCLFIYLIRKTWLQILGINGHIQALKSMKYDSIYCYVLWLYLGKWARQREAANWERPTAEISVRRNEAGTTGPDRNT